MAASLIHLLIVILVVGVILYAVQALPMDEGLKKAARIIGVGVVLILAIYILLSMLPLTAIG